MKLNQLQWILALMMMVVFHARHTHAHTDTQPQPHDQAHTHRHTHTERQTERQGQAQPPPAHSPESEYSRTRTAATPPMGFNHCFIGCGKGAWNASAHMKIADALISTGLRDAGYKYVNLDDGYMMPDTPGRRQPVAADPLWVLPVVQKYFPNMTQLGDYLHSRGLLFGLYTARGAATCDGFAGSCQMELANARIWAKWGVDYVKDDDCSPCTGYLEDYRRMQLAIAASGRPMVLSIEGLADPRLLSDASGRRRGQLKRVGHDVGAQWLNVMSMVDMASGLGYLAHNDSGWGGWWNDLDLLQLGHGDFDPGIGPDPDRLAMARAHFAMHSALKSPLLISAWIPNLAPAVVSLLKNSVCLEVNQDPLGIAAKRIRSESPSDVRIQAPLDANLVIAKCNNSRSTQSWTVSPRDAVGQLQSKSKSRWGAITEPCNVSSNSQKWALDSTRGWIRWVGSNLCIDSSAGANNGWLRTCSDIPSQKWYMAANHTIRQTAVDGALCILSGHYYRPIAISTCQPEIVNSSLGINARAAESWTWASGFLQVGNDETYLVAAGQCLAVTNVLHANAVVWTKVEDGNVWCIDNSTLGPGVFTATLCDPKSATAPLWRITLAEHAKDNETVIFDSGMCLTWSTEFGASGPLPHTRYLLVEAANRLAGGAGGCLPWTKVGGTDKSGALQPASSVVLDSDDHHGTVTSRASSDWCVDVVRGGNIEVWIGPLAGNRFVVVFLNRSPSIERVTASWQELGIDDGAHQTRDAWSTDDPTHNTSGITRTVPAHGAAMIIVD